MKKNKERQARKCEATYTTTKFSQGRPNITALMHKKNNKYTAHEEVNNVVLLTSRGCCEKFTMINNLPTTILSKKILL